MTNVKLTDEEVGRCYREGRAVLVDCDENIICMLLNWWQRPMDVARFDCAMIPPNAFVSDIFHDPSRRGFVIRLVHPSFDRVAAGCSPPTLCRTGIVMVDGQNEALPGLLEQHDSYDLGKGWSIGCRNPHEWCVYFNGKHLDSWIATHNQKPLPDSSQLTTYRTAITALTIWQATRAQYTWLELKDGSATE